MKPSHSKISELGVLIMKGYITLNQERYESFLIILDPDVDIDEAKAVLIMVYPESIIEPHRDGLVFFLPAATRRDAVAQKIQIMVNRMKLETTKSL